MEAVNQLDKKSEESKEDTVRVTERECILERTSEKMRNSLLSSPLLPSFRKACRVGMLSQYVVHVRNPPCGEREALSYQTTHSPLSSLRLFSLSPPRA